jgi:ribosomal protein L24
MELWKRGKRKETRMQMNSKIGALVVSGVKHDISKRRGSLEHMLQSGAVSTQAKTVHPSRVMTVIKRCDRIM